MFGDLSSWLQRVVWWAIPVSTHNVVNPYQFLNMTEDEGYHIFLEIVYAGSLIGVL